MLRIRDLIFDERNTEHIARHHVNPDEVEEACWTLPVVRRGKYGRLAVYGRTLVGRYLLVILAPKTGGDYYVITARPMTQAERRRYRQQKQG